MNQDNNIPDQDNFENFVFSFYGIREKNPFIVPENYFENLPGLILSKIENAEELKAISPTLSKIEKKNPFRVPENYFSKTKDFSKNLNGPFQKRTAGEEDLTENSGRTSTFEKKNPFVVPADYFNDLPERIKEKIEPIEIHPFLSVIDKVSFKIPAGYFENLPDRINQGIPAKKEAKIIRISKNILKYKYSSIAAAAAIAAMIGMYFFFPRTTSFDKKELIVSAEDISNSIFFQEIGENTIIEVINENAIGEAAAEHTEIENYLIDNDVDEVTIIDEL